MSDFRRIHLWEKRKREKTIRKQFRKEAEIPDQVYRSVGEAFRMIADGAVRQEAEVRGKSASRILVTRLAGCMAAVLLFCVLANVVFPAQVRALPVVGSIFEQIQEAVGYENLSEYAEPLVPAEEDEEADRKNVMENSKEKGREDDYTQTNGGLTVSVSEVYANPEAIYLSMKLKSEESFLKSFFSLEGADPEILDGTLAIFLNGQNSYSFMEETEPDDRSAAASQSIVEGLLVNENIFELLWRIGLEGDLRRYQENKDPAAVLPEEFTLDIEIDSICSLFSMEKTYTGPWNFCIPIKIDNSHTQTVEIRETSETGAGLVSVEKNPFEITTRAITPGIEGYKVAVLDAKGNKLPDVWSVGVVDMAMSEILSGQTVDVIQNKWRIDGNDTSSIEVFVLGMDFYENVYATGLWSGTDWEGNENKPEEEKLGTLLRKYAEYHKVINF